MITTSFKNKKAMNLKESKEGYMGEFGESKGKEEMMSSIYNPKNKKGGKYKYL